VVEGTKDPGESIRFEAFIQQAREHVLRSQISNLKSQNHR
jgi:hypothetical protein